MMNAAKRQRGLGRGLNALFEDDEVTFATQGAGNPVPEIPVPSAQNGNGISSYTPATAAPTAPAGPRRTLGIDLLQPSPFQPRQYMDENALSELAQSVAVHGVLQPILVRQVPGETNKWEIIAGERRWRAAQRAKLHEVPVVIRDFDDETAAEIALIENLQRADLNALEEAQGIKKLMEDNGHTQEKLAAVLGKSRSYVANMTRLLSLPAGVHVMMHEGKLSAGHAKILVNAARPEELARRIVAEGLSVREAEKMAAFEEKAKPTKSSSGRAAVAKDVNVVALEKDLTDKLGLKVSIDLRKNGRGAVRVDYKTLDQLDDVIRRLTNI